MSSEKTKPLVVITGSSGLIGTRLVDCLRGDYRLACLDIEFPGEPEKDVAQIECDLTDNRSVSQALADVRTQCGSDVESVIHLAAHYDFSGEPSPLYRELTIEGTHRLLKSLRTLRVNQFVFSSTLLVMRAPTDGEVLTAESPVEAKWEYPQSKLATEEVIRHLNNGIPAVILRIGGVYNENCHAVPIAQQIRRIYEKKLESYFFPGDRGHSQSFVHLDDLADCFRRVVRRRKELSAEEVFLIGEEDTMSYGELQEQIGQLIHGSHWPTIRIPKAVAKAGAWVKEKWAAGSPETPFIKPWMIDLADQQYSVSITKAHRTLGWWPRHTLRETLPEMVERLLRDPVRWYEVNGLPLPKHMREVAESAAV